MSPKSFVKFMQVMKWAAGYSSTLKKWVRVVVYSVVHLSVNMNDAKRILPHTPLECRYQK